ncbi:MAG: cation transporter [Solirubrobacteraceae bacterium]|nr:cation transporter [Solirubrobacteraceae bacterium]
MGDTHHHHDHHHGHDHSHAPSADADRKWLAIALAIIAGFMVVEVVAGVLADSLALLSDAAHMLTDAGAIALALVAARIALKPAGGRYTFGYGRAEILSAQINGATLLVLAGVIGVEGVRRLIDPPVVEGGVVIAVGLIGAAVNVAAAWALAKSERQSLNVEGARQHVLMDLYASLAAAAAGLVIVLTEFNQADAIASLVVAFLLLRSGWRLSRDAAVVLLEGAPRGTDPDAIGQALVGAPGVVQVHDLHVWEVTSGFVTLSAHVVVASGDDCHARRRELKELLRDEFEIEHTTLQVDHAPAPALLSIERHP